MIYLGLIFILLQLTLLARYIVFDAFEPVIYGMTFLFPAAGFIVFLVSKKFADKERSYQPKNITEWSFYHIQKSITNPKPLFKGNEQRGYVKRYFPKIWQYVLSDIFGSNWHLTLEIQIDQDVYDVHWERGKRLQDQWKIYKNGDQIGTARTRTNLKNSAKLKEVITYNIYDAQYESSALTITGSISLTQNDVKIGSLKRNHIVSSIKVIDVQENCPEYIVALIIHYFYFK